MCLEPREDSFRTIVLAFSIKKKNWPKFKQTKNYILSKDSISQ